jgi:gentisate 1,2-dioxygenase
MAAVSKPNHEGSVYTERARYHDPVNAFDFRWPSVPRRQFLAERERAFAEGAPTDLVVLDASDALETPYPATTPLLLARYARLGAGEELTTRWRASGEVYYVMHGAGESRNGEDVLSWSEGDLFCFPGGRETRHKAGDGDCLLFAVTNEPLLAFEGLAAPGTGEARVETVHWPAETIDAHLQTVWARAPQAEEAGQAVLFSSASLAPTRNTLPMMNVAINTLDAGKDQRPHRHNGVAITLALEGNGVHSLIEGERVDWVNGAAQITPAAELHSHHNRGSLRMRSLVVQDEGLHFYTRTPGFSWD